MEKLYEELEQVKTENENLKKLHNEQSLQLREARLLIEKLNAKTEDNNRIFEEEKRKLTSVLDEANEKKIDLEQKNNVYRAEIEGLKGNLGIAEKKVNEVEKSFKAFKEVKGRDDAMIRLEEERNQVGEKLKWKKEQFKHLEEAYEKLQNLFDVNKKEWGEERTIMLNEIYSLHNKLDSQIRISEELEKKLSICNSMLTQEETRRKNLEIQVSELKSKYEDVFVECQDVRTKLDDLVGKRDEEVAELRGLLSTKDSYFKEIKYENGKLEVENKELLVSLKELQEAMIQGSSNTALVKVKNKLRNLEATHKNCLPNLKSKEAEWSSRLEKMEEELNDYKLQLQSKEATLKEPENYSLLIEQLEEKNVALVKAQIEMEEERERVVGLMKRVETLSFVEEENLEMKKEIEKCKETVEEMFRFQAQMKQKLKEAEKDYEEKLLQVCDALDNTNSDLVAEREKVMGLTRKIECFDVVKENEIQRYKEMLEESEKSRMLLEKLESDSKENIRELCSKVDIAYAKLAEEVEKNASLIKKNESIERKRQELEEDLEMANAELFDKTSEVYQVEFQLWVWKSIAQRLKGEVEENQNLRKRVEASLLEQVGVGEGIREERNELLHKLKTVVSSVRLPDSEKDLMLLKKLEREVELLEEEALRREFEVFFYAHTTAEGEKRELVEEVASLSSEKRNLLCFIGELEDGMRKLCDEDSKVIMTIERVIDESEGFVGKENGENICSPRLMMKHEVVTIEDRSPFRQLNH